MKEWTATWSSKQNLNSLLFFLFVVFLPTQFGYHFWPEWALVSGLRVDYFSPTITIIDLVVLLLFAVNLSTFKIPAKKAGAVTAVAVVAVLAFAAANTYLSLSPMVAVYKWLKLSEFIFLGYWAYRNKTTVTEHISKPLTIALGYTFLLGLTQFATGKTIGGIFYFLGERSFSAATPGIALVNLFGGNFLRVYGTFPHPNVLAGFSIVGLLLILFFEKNKKLKLIGMGIAAANVFLSFSLGAIIALVVCLVVYILRLYKPLVHIYKQIILGGVLISILLMPAGQRLLRGDVSLPETIEKRLRLSVVAGEAISSSPVFGVGQGNFISFIPGSTIEKNPWFLQPVHNIFLLIVSETGTIGLIVFAGILISLKIKTNPKNLLLILPILITGLFDHYWLTVNQGAFLFALVAGILF